MRNDEVIHYLEKIQQEYDCSYEEVALNMAIKAVEQVGCLTDRPCPFCRFKTENGCNRWECVFKGV